jgi:hypothetical protein
VNANRIFNVTGASDNGSGAIRLTIVPSASGVSVSDLVDGYRVVVSAVGGVPNASGVWTIDVSGTNTIDLVGSAWAGAYTSGGTVKPPMGWRDGIAFRCNDSDGPLFFQCFANNYTVGYWIDTTASGRFSDCTAEGYGEAHDGNIGLYVGPGTGRSCWIGGGLSVYTTKIIYESSSLNQITGISTGGGACMRMNSGTLTLDGTLEGTVYVGDGIDALSIVGGTVPPVTGTAIGLRKTIIGPGRQAGANAKMTGLTTELAVRRTDGSELSALRLDTTSMRLWNDMQIVMVTGSPEGVVTARRGSLALRTDGGAGTTLYVKEAGTGNTGWIGK